MRPHATIECAKQQSYHTPHTTGVDAKASRAQNCIVAEHCTTAAWRESPFCYLLKILFCDYIMLLYTFYTNLLACRAPHRSSRPPRPALAPHPPLLRLCLAMCHDAADDSLYPTSLFFLLGLLRALGRVLSPPRLAPKNRAEHARHTRPQPRRPAPRRTRHVFTSWHFVCIWHVCVRDKKDLVCYWRRWKAGNGQYIHDLKGTNVQP